MAAGRIKGSTVEIGGDTTKLQQALKGVNSEIKNTQSQLKDVEKLFLNYIEEGTDENSEQRAKELLAKLAEYKPLEKIEEMEEQNYNMIDNVLNNGVEKFNRKEDKQKLQQGRTSLKERHAFKRAGSIEKDDEEIDLPEDLLQLLNESSPKE